MKIKQGLENLVGQIEGLKELTVNIEMLEGCTGDMILESIHQDEQALKHYKEHPKHLEVATIVRASVQNRLAADFKA